MQLSIVPSPQQPTSTIAIVTSGTQDQQVMAQLRHLLAEVGDSYPELAGIHFLSVPLSKNNFSLESWSYWLAAQAISQWRELPLEYSSVGDIVAQLGLVKSEKCWSILDALQRKGNDSTLSLELIKRIDRIRHRHNYHQLVSLSRQKCVDREVAVLADWFAHPVQSGASDEQGCMAQLLSNRDAIGLQQRHQFKKFFDSLQRSGSRAVLRALQTLAMTLASLMADYEAHQMQCIEKENAVHKSYRQLRAKLLESPRSFGRRQADWETIWQAVAKYYQFKLEAEVYTQASQLLEELKHQTDIYTTTAIHIDELLAGMQQWFSDRASTEPIAAPLLRKYLAEQVDSLKLRQEMEELVGCPLHQWGSLDLVQHRLLRQTILTRLQPLCWEVYAECYQFFMNADASVTPAPLQKAVARVAEIVPVINSSTLQRTAETYK